MTKQELADLLARTTPEDFDGHTEFANFTAEQRIEWLEQLAWFVYESKGIALPEGHPERKQRA